MQHLLEVKAPFRYRCRISDSFNESGFMLYRSHDFMLIHAFENGVDLIYFRKWSPSTARFALGRYPSELPNEFRTSST
jgi:hypothetical protein